MNAIQFVLRGSFFVYRLLWGIYRNLSFKAFGAGSYLYRPLRIDCPWNIVVGKSVYVGYKCWLAANPLTDSSVCELQIQDGVTIGNFNHIYATGRIILEKDVLTADKVYISDNLHCYKDIHIPVRTQPIIQHGEVVIGEGS